MKDMKINDWTSLVATVGVLAGLLLVTLELRTINDMAEAEAVRDRLAIGHKHRLICN